MKSFYNKLNIITICFIIGILFSVFNLYNLPLELEKVSGKIDLSIVKELNPVLNQTYFIIGMTFVLGLGSIIFGLYLLNNTKTAEKIIYIEKTESQKQVAEEKEEKRKKENIEKQVKHIQSGVKDIKDQELRYEKLLSNLCMKIEASQGILYLVHKEKSKRYIKHFVTFAFNLAESEVVKYEFGEGLAGQVAKEGKTINIGDIPEGYITIISGLGKASPKHLAILPITENGEITHVAEIASFKEISTSDENLIMKSLKLSENASKQTNKKDAKKKSDDKKESDL